MRIVFTLILFFGSIIPCLAQNLSVQNRIVVHTTLDVTDQWFLTNWTIGNVRQNVPDNFNIFPGVGFRSHNWWVEAMVQRQWSKPGNSWALDFRYSLNLTKRVLLYTESAPLLTSKGEYEFLFVDVRTWKNLAFGAETENVHHAGKDSIGAGPRLSFPLASIGQYKLSLGGTYQFRRSEADIARLYIVFNRRFKK